MPVIYPYAVLGSGLSSSGAADFRQLSSRQSGPFPACGISRSYTSAACCGSICAALAPEFKFGEFHDQFYPRSGRVHRPVREQPVIDATKQMFYCVRLLRRRSCDISMMRARSKRRTVAWQWRRGDVGVPSLSATIHPGLSEHRSTEICGTQFLCAAIEALSPRHRARTPAQQQPAASGPVYYLTGRGYVEPAPSTQHPAPKQSDQLNLMRQSWVGSAPPCIAGAG